MSMPENSRNPNLTLTVDTNDYRTHLGDTVSLDVVLRNAGNVTLPVNGRLLLNSERSPESCRELFLQILGPPGYFNLIKFNIRSGPPTREFFANFGPSEEIRKSYEITKINSLHLAGEYRIRFVYSNVHGYEVAGKKAWTGTLQSNEITILRLAPGDARNPT